MAAAMMPMRTIAPTVAPAIMPGRTFLAFGSGRGWKSAARAGEE